MWCHISLSRSVFFSSDSFPVSVCTSLLFPSLFFTSPLAASVPEDGEASLQSHSSHCGCQGSCQEQPLVPCLSTIPALYILLLVSFGTNSGYGLEFWTSLSVLSPFPFFLPALTSP